jgi:hypothetical protein
MCDDKRKGKERERERGKDRKADRDVTNQRIGDRSYVLKKCYPRERKEELSDT